MFKHIQYFRIGADWHADAAAIEAALAQTRFVACAPTQERSIGWVEPRGEANGPLLESIGGHYMMRLLIESKVIPGGALRDALDKRLQAIESEQGRKPGKRETREIAEDLRTAMLAQAFTTKTSVWVWIAPESRLLVIESGAQARTDMVTTELIKVLDGLQLSPVVTEQAPASCMAAWLNSQEPPAAFTADRDCVLKATDESKATVRYAQHALDIDEVRAHIAAGKLPTQLAMTWNDRLSFVLTDRGTIKKIAFHDGVFAGTNETGFDADVAIATGELSQFIPALTEALGGEVVAA